MTCPTNQTCSHCQLNTELYQPGLVDTNRYQYVVALAGNPNTGKSTVFNALTGLNQRTGNWPGKTVTRAEGGFKHDNIRYKLVDLPGTYSLLSASTDEEVARDFLLFGNPDCTVVVLDATALQRNLNLALQVMEITSKTVLCVNLMDEARRKGLKIDLEQLTLELGVPTVGCSARSREGISELIKQIADVTQDRIQTKPKLPATPPKLKNTIDRIVLMIESILPGLPNTRWIAYRLLEGDLRIRRALESGAITEIIKMNRDRNPD